MVQGGGPRGGPRGARTEFTAIYYVCPSHGSLTVGPLTVVSGNLTVVSHGSLTVGVLGPASSWDRFRGARLSGEVSEGKGGEGEERCRDPGPLAPLVSRFHEPRPDIGRQPTFQSCVFFF